MSSASRLGVGADRLGVALGLLADLVGVAHRGRADLGGLLLGQPQHRGGAAAEAGVRRVLVLRRARARAASSAVSSSPTRALGLAEAAVEALALAGQLAQVGVDGGLVVAAAAHRRQRGPAAAPARRRGARAAGGCGPAAAARLRGRLRCRRAAPGLGRGSAGRHLGGARRPAAGRGRRRAAGSAARAGSADTGLLGGSSALGRPGDRRHRRPSLRQRRGRGPVARGHHLRALGGRCRSVLDVVGLLGRSSSGSSSKMDRPRSLMRRQSLGRGWAVPLSLQRRRDAQAHPASRADAGGSDAAEAVDRLLRAWPAARRRGRRGPPRAPGRARRPCPGGRCGGRRARPGRPPRAGRSADSVGWIIALRDQPVGLPRLAVVGEVGADDPLEVHPEVAVVVLVHEARSSTRR